MLLRINNISKSFRNTNAVRNVSFDVNPGDYIAIIGPSGSGKTTLLSLLTGMLTPTGGEILYNNKKLKSLSQRELSRIRAFDMGLVFQFSELVPSLTVEENILLPGLFTRKYTETEYLKKSEYLLHTLDLEKEKDELPFMLSGGQIQKTAIARALINDPSVLLADEPSGDLDPGNSDRVQRLFSEYNKKGLTILLVTHDMQMAYDSKTVYEMEKGSIKNIMK